MTLRIPYLASGSLLALCEFPGSLDCPVLALHAEGANLLFSFQVPG